MGYLGGEVSIELCMNKGSKRFERGWLFKGLNFTGRASEQWSITGPNGSGKSTLLLSLGGYIELTEGSLSLRFSGRDWPDLHISRHTALASHFLTFSLSNLPTTSASSSGQGGSDLLPP